MQAGRLHERCSREKATGREAGATRGRAAGLVRRWAGGLHWPARPLLGRHARSGLVARTRQRIANFRARPKERVLRTCGFRGGRLRPMAENTPPQQQQVQLRIDESKMQTTYANTIRTSTTQDEVVLDFGINLPVPGQDNQPVLVFGVGSRVVMNWAGAKRLAMSLGQVVRQYEERNGEIQLNRGAGGAPRLSQ